MRAGRLVGATMAIAMAVMPAVAAQQDEGDRPSRRPPDYHHRGHDPYPGWDADDHPDDWQPTHDHRRVQHLRYADCGDTPDRALVLCTWEPSAHVDFAAYELWYASQERPLTLIARIEQPAESTYAHTEPYRVDHLAAYMVRVVDQRGELLAHTFPVLVNRYDRRPRPFTRRLLGGDAAYVSPTDGGPSRERGSGEGRAGSREQGSKGSHAGSKEHGSWEGQAGKSRHDRGSAGHRS